MQFVFEKLDFHKSLLILIDTNIKFHLQVIETTIEVIGNLLNGLVPFLLRFFVLLPHAVTPLELSQGEYRPQDQDKAVLPHNVLETLKQQCLGYRYEQQQTHSCDDRVVRVNCPFQQRLRLLVLTDVEKAVHVLYQLFQGLVVDVKIGYGQVIDLETQSLIVFPVYFYTFCHRNSLQYASQNQYNGVPIANWPQTFLFLHQCLRLFYFKLLLPFYLQLVISIAITKRLTKHNKIITAHMINANMYSASDRSHKVGVPTSPPAKRKNIEYALHSPTPNAEYLRKDTNNVALSPNTHYYSQKPSQSKPLDQSSEREASLQGIIRDLSEKVIRMSQKLGQHQAILIKITENSIESNKQQFKRSNQATKTDFVKTTENLSQSMNRLRKDFDDFKAIQMNSREFQLKHNAMVQQLMRRSDQKMKEQLIRIENVLSIRLQKPMTAPLSLQRIEELQKGMKKLQKNLSANTLKLGAALQRIEEVNTSIDGHMQLINAEVNKAISKIVTFVNEKISKPLNESVANLSERMFRVESQPKATNNQSACHFAGYRSSSLRSQKSINRAEYRQVLSAFNQQLIISENTYYIDSEGYLLDRDLCYLVDDKSERIRLDEKQIRLLMSERMLD